MRRQVALMQCSAAIALLLSVPAAFAQQPQAAAAQKPAMQAQAAGAPLSRPDQAFVKDAAIGGLYEVEMGKVAAQNGEAPVVKQFGARMVQDHSAANAKFAALTGKLGVEAPQQLDARHQQDHDRLATLHGASFDRAYIADMVKDHNEDIKKFRTEARSGGNPQLKEFARNSLPMLEMHDRLAHAAERQLTAVSSAARTK